MSFSGGFMSVMFTIVPILVVMGFILVFGMIIINAARGMKQWSYNNAQPILTVNARVVAKRTDVTSRRHHDMNGVGHHHHYDTYSHYYITFEVESGSRMEFEIKNNDFGLLVEGDVGKLTFQGTRYLGFQREMQQGV